MSNELTTRDRAELLDLIKRKNNLREKMTTEINMQRAMQALREERYDLYMDKYNRHINNFASRLAGNGPTLKNWGIGLNHEALDMAGAKLSKLEREHEEFTDAIRNDPMTERLMASDHRR